MSMLFHCLIFIVRIHYNSSLLLLIDDLFLVYYMNNIAMKTFLLGHTYLSRLAAYWVFQTVFQSYYSHLYSHQQEENSYYSTSSTTGTVSFKKLNHCVDGTSLAVQWLRFCTSTTGCMGLSLVGELGSHMPYGMAKRKNKNQINHYIGCVTVSPCGFNMHFSDG